MNVADSSALTLIPDDVPLKVAVIIWIADAYRDDRRRFVVRASELLTAFLELESLIPGSTEPQAV